MEDLGEIAYKTFYESAGVIPIKWGRLTEVNQNVWHKMTNTICKLERKHNLELLINELNRQGLHSDGIEITLKAILDHE